MKIYLIPSDFINSDYTDPHGCALHKAFKRRFKGEVANVNPFHIYGKSHSFEILNGGFIGNDYYFVKNEYSKDPKMEKCQYYVEIKKCKY